MPTKQEAIDIEPLLSTHQQWLGMVMDEANSIESKALAMLAASITLLIFIAQAGFHFSHWWHGFLVVLPHLLTIVLVGCAVWPRRYLGPSLELEAYRRHAAATSSELVARLLANVDYAIQFNSHLNAVRWRFCIGAIALTILGALVLFVIL